MLDATDEETFLAAAQPLEEIIGYIGAMPLYRFGRKQELMDALVLHMVYTRKKTTSTQYVRLTRVNIQNNNGDFLSTGIRLVVIMFTLLCCS